MFEKQSVNDYVTNENLESIKHKIQKIAEQSNMFNLSNDEQQSCLFKSQINTQNMTIGADIERNKLNKEQMEENEDLNEDNEDDKTAE